MIYPICIYGFIEEEDNYIIDSDLLLDFNCYIFAEDLSNKLNSKSGIYYGIECYLDNTTGQLSVSEIDKQSVHELHKKYVEFKKNINPNFEIPEIGYHLCLDGEIDYYYKINYTFEDSLIKNDIYDVDD
jgi:hypothetical protein